jgi:hypothetical protein
MDWAGRAAAATALSKGCGTFDGLPCLRKAGILAVTPRPKVTAGPP